MKFLSTLSILLLCSIPLESFGQLPAFNFTVSVTNETCTSNAMLSMTATGTVSNAQVIYRLFRAPDFTTVIAQTMTSSFLTLEAGNYRVVATQSLNGFSSSQQRDVVIQNLKEDLEFELTDTSAIDCDVTATLSVIVISGNPVGYEIISGPVTRPLQTSNQFTNLTSGTYTIRVFDQCNDAITKQYTFLVGNNDFSIGAPTLPQTVANCNSTTITNQISSNTAANILYPLVVKYTVFAPDNSVAQTSLQNILSGNSSSFQLVQEIPLFGSQLFNVKIEVTDNCGNTFSEIFQIDPNPRLSIQRQNATCGELFFTLAATNYTAPYTLNFTSSPQNFDANEFNVEYPGSYTQPTVTFGSMQNPVPFGSYSVSIVDACGRTKKLSFQLIEQPVDPSVTVANNGCDSSFGSAAIKLSQNRTITSILLVQAPHTYPNPLPEDLMQFVTSDGSFFHPSLPIGEYEFFITDSCGDTYTVTAIVPAFVFGPLVGEAKPDCSPTTGSVKLATSNGALSVMTITAAPLAFGFQLPYDVSVNINSEGVFYMSELPVGSYTFQAIDNCGFSLAATIQIEGYQRNSEGFSLTRKCGSFDIVMNDTDESISGKRFWLQKFFPSTNLWGHPYTGISFQEGSIPNSTNALAINNPSTLLNVFLVGDFRIMKSFDTFDTVNFNAQCADLYTEFTVTQGLQILGAYNLSCDNGIGPDNVVIDVAGVGPFNFQMTSPSFLDNGENNIFDNLSDGLYNFKVTDNCGNIKNITVDIGNLLPLAQATKPQSMLVCRTDGVAFGIFPLVNQTAQILGTQDPNTYTVTYHASQNDADTGQNPLPDGYTNISNPQTIYARVQHKTLPLCYATTFFNIFTGMSPVLSPEIPTVLCQGSTAVLQAETGYTSYLWSTGATTTSIVINEPGTYTVTVKNVYEDFSCETVKTFVVNGSSKAIIQEIDVRDWSSNQNSATVIVNGSGTYTYSLDNINFQTSNVFNDLMPGEYTVYVKDNDCGTVSAPFAVVTYPKFFTPNGDGYNDTWNITFTNNEPDLQIDVFDRFSRLLKRLRPDEPGWDGTFNGQVLPSTDYWFVVKRQSGIIHKGHFTLKR